MESELKVIGDHFSRPVGGGGGSAASAGPATAAVSEEPSINSLANDGIKEDPIVGEEAAAASESAQVKVAEKAEAATTTAQPAEQPPKDAEAMEKKAEETTVQLGERLLKEANPPKAEPSTQVPPAESATTTPAAEFLGKVNGGKKSGESTPPQPPPPAAPPTYEPRSEQPLATMGVNDAGEWTFRIWTFRNPEDKVRDVCMRPERIVLRRKYFSAAGKTAPFWYERCVVECGLVSVCSPDP